MRGGCSRRPSVYFCGGWRDQVHGAELDDFAPERSVPRLSTGRSRSVSGASVGREDRVAGWVRRERLWALGGFLDVGIQRRSGDQVHCVCSLAWIEAFAAAVFPPPVAGCLEAGLGALPDERAFELGEGAENVEDEPSAARIGVDGLLEALEADAPGAEVLGPGDQVLERPAKAIEAPHDRGISGPKVGKRLVEVRPLGGGAGGVFEDLFAAGLRECIALEVEGLVVGQDPGVTNQHPFVSRNPSREQLTVP